MNPLESDGNAGRNLTEQDYGKEGEIKTLSGDLALVVGSAAKAEAYISQKSWALLWRDADFRQDGPL
jgi:hypothetical protein